MEIYKLERHTYAPELNKIHLENGVVLKAPQVTTLLGAQPTVIKYINLVTELKLRDEHIKGLEDWDDYAEEQQREYDSVLSQLNSCLSV